MHQRRLSGVWASLTVGAAIFAGTAMAQEQPSAEIQQYKQRTEALEKKVEMLERATREAGSATDDQIEQVVQRLAKQKEKPTDFNVYWKDGLNFESRDKQFKLNIGGRLFYDAAWLGEDRNIRRYTIPGASAPLGDQLDGTELRLGRVALSGTIYGNVDYKFEVDFTGSEKGIQKDVKAGGSGKAESYKTSTVALKDAYLGFRDLIPYAYLRAGHFYEPISLEQLTSDNFTLFMERSLPIEAFMPGRNAGLALSNAILNDRATWAVGVFRDTNDRGFSQSEGGYNFTGRVTGLPWYEEEGRELVHVGAGASYRNPESTIQFTSRPEMHLASKFVDTGAMTSDDAMLYNGELAGVYGPFSAQAEVFYAYVNRVGLDSVSFDGAYVEASYFLTGENRNYKKSAGVFDRIRPKKNFGTTKDGGKGWGAWELAARYSYVDLNDADVHGGKLSDATLGLNWYLNPNTRIMLNGVHAMLEDNHGQDGGDANMLGLRFQVDF